MNLRYFGATYLLVMFLAINSTIATAQCGECSHLEPAKGILDDWDHSIEYNLKFKEYFLANLPEYYEIRYIVTPSFTDEYVFQISRNRDTYKLEVDLLVGKNSVWYDVVSRKPYEDNPYSEEGKTGFDKDNPAPIPIEKFDIKHYKASITEDDFTLLKELMDTIILQTKYYPPRYLIGADGTTYFFTVRLDGFKSGEIWSPPEGSNMERLISIFEEMCDRTKKKRRLKIDSELRSRIKTLKIDINEP